MTTRHHAAARPAKSGSLVAVAASIALVLAACGDDDEPSADSSSDISTAETTASSEPGGTATEMTAGPTTDATTTDATTLDDTATVDTEPPSTASAATSEPDSGGSDEDGWRQQMNVLCDASRADSAAIEEPQTVGELGRAVGELVEVGDTLVDGARELETPESVQADVDELITLWEEKREQLEGLPARFEDAGYADDDSLGDISNDEAEEVAGDALDQSELQDQSQQLDITCFGNA